MWTEVKRTELAAMRVSVDLQGWLLQRDELWYYRSLLKEAEDNMQAGVSEESEMWRVAQQCFK